MRNPALELGQRICKAYLDFSNCKMSLIKVMIFDNSFNFWLKLFQWNIFKVFSLYAQYSLAWTQLFELSSSTNFKRVNSRIYVLILKANLFLKSPISKFSRQIWFNFDIQMSQKQKTPNTDCAVCTNPNFQPIAWKR